MDRIHDFLKLDLKHAQAGGTPTFDLPQTVAPLFAAEGGDSSPAADDASSATSEESFEQVSTADLAEYDATAAEAKLPQADPLPNQEQEESATLDQATGDVETSSSGDVADE